MFFLNIFQTRVRIRDVRNRTEWIGVYIIDRRLKYPLAEPESGQENYEQIATFNNLKQVQSNLA